MKTLIAALILVTMVGCTGTDQQSACPLTLQQFDDAMAQFTVNASTIAEVTTKMGQPAQTRFDFMVVPPREELTYYVQNGSVCSPIYVEGDGSPTVLTGTRLDSIFTN